MENKYTNVINAYTTIKKGNEDITIFDTDKVKQAGVQKAIQDIQYNLGTAFDISYDIMADACGIISEKTLELKGESRDSLVGEELDFFADADSIANVYTGVQLSYLSANNEQEISELMKDEAITSIAQACSIWYSRKVAEACEEL